MKITDILTSLVSSALESTQSSGSLPPAGDFEIKIERPKLADHGDFSTSLPLALARTMGMPPIQIAEAISTAIPENEMIGMVEPAAPGFVNFTLSTSWLQSQVGVVRKAGLVLDRITPDLGNVSKSSLSV